MSKLHDIISRVVTDDDFRTAFLAEPIKAAEEYNLSESELAELKAIDFNELSSINTELEERLSKSFVSLPNFSDNSDVVQYSDHGSVHSSDGW
jgi:hypothetical protein